MQFYWPFFKTRAEGSSSEPDDLKNRGSRSKLKHHDENVDVRMMKISLGGVVFERKKVYRISFERCVASAILIDSVAKYELMHFREFMY